MLELTFRPAARTQNRLKMALDGPAGSGKTFTALRLGHSLGDEVFVIDTQYGAAALYAGENIDGKVWNFKHLTLSQHDVDHYQNAISAAEKQGADVIVIDSLSNAWDDCGGILDQVERKSEQRNSDGKMTNTFTAWQKGTKMYKSLIRAILESPCHIIATMRTKNEYVIDTDERGKTRIRKLGLKPIQREGIDYEFDLVFSLNHEHVATVTKTHSKAFPMDWEIPEPGAETAKRILEWLRGDAKQPVISQEVASTEPVKDQPPEHTSEEIAAMKEHIRKSIGTVITPEQYWAWRKEYKLRPEDPLQDYYVIVLHGDITAKEQTGEWRPTPF